LPVPPPPGRKGDRLGLVGSPEAEPGRVAELLLTDDGAAVGTLVVGREPDRYADAVVGAVLDADLRLVIVDDPSTRSLNGRADRVVQATDNRDRVLTDTIRDLQRAGDVVLTITSDEAALAAADVGIGIVSTVGRVPWAAGLLVGPGLTDLPRIIAAVPEAKAVVARGVQLALGASFLGGLLAAVGTGRRGGATLPVNGAAGSALVSAYAAARRVDQLSAPEPFRHVPWHALEPDDVLSRLAEDPPLPSPGRPPDQPPWAELLRFLRTVRAELADPLTPVLATGAAASAVIGSLNDAALVGSVLAANAVVSGLQRLRAESAARELFESERPVARLISGAGDDTSAIPADDLRPGDLIVVNPGDVVPADARLLDVDNLEMDEAGLTGESIAVPKQVRATPGAELADRACMIYEGSTVLAGTGRAVVVAVGSQTEAGRALQLARRSPAPAGMQARLEELTRRGLPVTLLGGAAVTLLGLLRGQPLRGALGSGVSVAVAAVPEGLPLVATVAQLSAARRLSNRGVLVRSARTVEALGRVDTMCFDKTGTLTEGRLRLVRVAGFDGEWPADAPEARPVLRAAARACPQPGGEVAHATDRAVLDAAIEHLGPELGADWDGLTEVPFQSDRGFSATVGRLGGELRLVVKGAPEVLLPRCGRVLASGTTAAIDRAARTRADEVVDSLAGQGLRVLAVAARQLHGAPTDLAEDDAEELADDMVLLGFVALADTARPAAADTVGALAAAGIDPVMITGDHPVTARAIARDLGIDARRVVTGPELAEMADEQRTSAVADARVFARVSPEQKLRIVRALQRAGRVVAMTGDGANDAAAIRLADVGIGMTNAGSAAARSASDLVLVRPDLRLLVDSLVEGRAMWRRVRDAVSILLGGNAGEVLFTLAGTGISGRAPIGTRQFLLVNMLTDLMPAMAIALAATPDDEAARTTLLVEGRPSLGSALTRDLAVRGGATAAGALLAWQIGRVTGTRGRASTMALAALVGTQLGQTLLVGARNPIVVATALGSTAVLVAIVQTPGLSAFFGCRPLGPVAWATVAGSAGAATLGAAVAGRLTSRPTAG
jgi:cation-transporting ATPase I